MNNQLLKQEMSKWGAAAGQVRLFEDDDLAKHIDYKDIYKSNFSLHIQGVVERQGSPLVYIASDYSLLHDNKNELNNICRSLACRGENSFLGIVTPGKLVLLPCILTGASEYLREYSSNRSPTLIRSLTEGIIPNDLQAAQKKIKEVRLKEKILDSFIEASTCLRDIHNAILKEYEEKALTNILAILGRALFIRFLYDRELIPNNIVPGRGDEYELSHFFDSPESTSHIFKWLDDTFNGDLLPLYALETDNAIHDQIEYYFYFSKLPKCFFQHLNGFANGSPSRGSLISLVNFAYVPTGLLSEVYEEFAHKFFSKIAKDTSIYYTPRHIAAFLVEQAFNGLSLDDKSRATVIDPTVGAGIFIVLALRTLVKERLNRKEEITATSIRQLLYSNIRGIDTNPHALRLATLALYLTAIELDPCPKPLTENHRFERPLIGSVLWEAKLLGGSLNLDSTNEILPTQFDLVISNPPWTRLENQAEKGFLRNQASRIFDSIINEEDCKHDPLQNTINQQYLELVKSNPTVLSPNNAPYFPFVWRSLQLARPGGNIALVLPAEHFLFREHQSRELVFRHIRVTGIINGSDLRESNFWPNVDAPFCLVFGKKCKVLPEDDFLFLSLWEERNIHDYFRIRIDPSQVRRISFMELENNKTLLKTLFRGTNYDLNILSKLKSAKTVSIASIIEKERLQIGKGYEICTPKNKSEYETKLSVDEIERRANNFKKLQDLNGNHIHAKLKIDRAAMVLDEVRFPLFNESCDFILPKNTGKIPIYFSPVVIIPESAYADAFCYIGKRPLIYSQSFRGISTVNSRNSKELAVYLTAIFWSGLPRYVNLLTSSRYGVSRKTTLIEEILSFPVIPYSDLSADEKRFCQEIARSDKGSLAISRDKIVKWVYSLYDLTEFDVQIINDTLHTRCPSKRAFAQRQPDMTKIHRFCSYIEEKVCELYKLYDSKGYAKVELLHSLIDGWVFIEIKSPCQKDYHLPDLGNIIQDIASEEGISILTIKPRPGVLLCGVLNQNRYLTLCSAANISRDILMEIDSDPIAWELY